MTKRPRSVTVICWILIAMSGISLITSTWGMDNPEVKELMSRSPIPISLQYGLVYLGLLVTVVSAFAMLYRQNWARLLYVTWGVIGFAIGIATSPVQAAMIPGAVIFIVIVFFLFRPRPNEYFRAVVAKDQVSGTQNS